MQSTGTPLSYCLFDKQGVCDPRWNFFLTAGAGTEHSGANFYRKLVNEGRKVLVMAGVRSWDALIPALETKMFNILITDEHTANRLVGAKSEYGLFADTPEGFRLIRKVKNPADLNLFPKGS
jgi:hypothetical protein